MILFSTMLRINDTMTKDDFIKLVIQWNQGMTYTENVIPGLQWTGERAFHCGTDNLWLDAKEYASRNIIAVRFEKRDDDGAVWDTDYVMNFNDMTMSIRLERSYEESALGKDLSFSPPYFISLLIDNHYLADDHGLPVLRRPLWIEDDNLRLVADIVNREASYDLPVVYVSQTDLNEDPVNVQELAAKLKGMAHILVQKLNRTNTPLREMCDDNNEYFGAVGIYFPSENDRHRRYLYTQNGGCDHFLMKRVIRSVVSYNNSKNIDPLYTWQGVTNALLLERIEDQKADRQMAEIARREAEEKLTEYLQTLPQREREITEKAFAETQKLIDSFDDEITGYREQIQELTAQNMKLLNENHGIKAKLDSLDNVPVLCLGEENELFEGEAKDMVLSVLADARETVREDSRRRLILNDLIESNDYHAINENKAAELKRLLDGYTKMDSKIRGRLEALGFTITEDGKHYKLLYCNDSRYTFSLAKTASDSQRGGKNTRQEIIKKVL